jgi:hypothetical protein
MMQMFANPVLVVLLTAEVIYNDDFYYKGEKPSQIDLTYYRFDLYLVPCVKFGVRPAN